MPSEINDISKLDRDNEVLPRDDRHRLFQLGNPSWHSDSSCKTVPAHQGRGDQGRVVCCQAARPRIEGSPARRASLFLGRAGTRCSLEPAASDRYSGPVPRLLIGGDRERTA